MDVEQLNKIRKLQNLSVEEVAKKANLPKSTVEKVLFGIVKHPRIDTMEAIEKALGITSDKNEQENEIYTEQEKRLIKAFRTLIPSMQENILELVESMSTNVKGKGNYA